MKNKLVQVIAFAMSFAPVACGTSGNDVSSSQIKVTNGISADSEFPSVVMLKILTEDNSTSICTGTFVNSSQVVTAAHCIYDNINDSGHAIKSVAFVKRKVDGSKVTIDSTDRIYRPEYTHQDQAVNGRDVAVITFPKGSAPAISPLYKKTPAIGTLFTIVGFGLNEYHFSADGTQTGTGSGKKRKGQNEVKTLSDDGLIGFSGLATATDSVVEAGFNVASGSGDSGGPLLIDGSIAGVTSGGGLVKTTDEHGVEVVVKTSKYVNLNEPANKAFLKKVLVSSSLAQ